MTTIYSSKHTICQYFSSSSEVQLLKWALFELDEADGADVAVAFEVLFSVREEEDGAD